jgi:hypothetical protein
MHHQGSTAALRAPCGEPLAARTASPPLHSQEKVAKHLKIKLFSSRFHPAKSSLKGDSGSLLCRQFP